jgi:hypothetical protein
MLHNKFFGRKQIPVYSSYLNGFIKGFWLSPIRPHFIETWSIWSVRKVYQFTKQLFVW